MYFSFELSWNKFQNSPLPDELRVVIKLIGETLNLRFKSSCRDNAGIIPFAFFLPFPLMALLSVHLLFAVLTVAKSDRGEIANCFDNFHFLKIL